MTKYDFIYDKLAFILGGVDGSFQTNKYPHLYLRISDDDTEELTALEAGQSNYYKRKVLLDIFYQNKYDNNLNNEQAINAEINSKSDEIELLLHGADLNDVYKHTINNEVKYEVYLSEIKIINNNRAVQNNIGLLWIQLEINYTQLFY